MNIKTTDLCDENAKTVRVAEPIGFKDFGGRKNFLGIIQAVKCFEDNSFVRKAVEQNRDRKVWAGDGDGSLRYALLGYRIGI